MDGRSEGYAMVDIRRLYDACLARGPGPKVTASDILQFARAPFMLWCDYHAPEEAKDPISEYQKLLFEQGKLHEDKTVEAEMPGAKRVTYETPEEGFRIVLESMRDGLAAMHNAPLFYLPEGLEGRADILERSDEHPSSLGDYHYTVKEIKLAKNIKDYHRVQPAFYNYILGKVQGYTSPYYTIINRDRDSTAYPYYESEVLAAIDEVREVIGGKEVSPTYGSSDWPWATYCNQEAIRRRDVSLVGGVGPSFKERLVEAGIGTVPQLASTKIADLTKIAGIGNKRAQKFQTNSTAMVKGTHIKLKDIGFPTVPTEIFLDLEGTGEQMPEDELVPIDYLIGTIVRKGGKEKYRYFLAENLDAEGEMFHNFLRWLADQSDYIIYHWHSYERTHLKRLAERHGVPKRMEDQLFGRLRDLYKDAVSGFAFPTYGYGLKHVANYMGFSWGDEEIDAMESAALYFQFIQDPENNRDKLQKVLEYNEDDCMATRVVKDWIERECG